jgi:hypothetical protein
MNYILAETTRVPGLAGLVRWLPKKIPSCAIGVIACDDSVSLPDSVLVNEKEGR